MIPSPDNLLQVLKMRAMTVDDIASGLQLCRVSGWNQLEADWRVFLESPGGCGWLAELDGRAVGTVTFLRYGLCRACALLSVGLAHDK